MAIIINDIIKIMQELAPENHTMPGYNDNVGLLIGDKNASLDMVYCCLDLTNRHIEEAINQKAQLIICHHPIIYTPIKTITADTVLGAKLLKLIQHGIAVYAAHTNLDFCEGGLNDYAAQLLNLKNTQPLDPYISPNAGTGRIGELEKTISLKELAKKVSLAFDDPLIEIIGDEDKKIKTVAIINGGGGNIEGLELAKSKGADCYISGDFKHSTKVYALDLGFPIIQASHHHTESVFISQLQKILYEKTKHLKISISYSIMEFRGVKTQ